MQTERDKAKAQVHDEGNDSPSRVQDYRLLKCTRVHSEVSLYF